jgi:hypothetical protein
MRLETKIAVPYSVVFVFDRKHGDTPDSMSTQLVSATSSCVAIGTLPDSEGETLIVLTTDERVITEGLLLAYNGTIETPNCEISVSTALNEEILTVPNVGCRCRISVWVNDKKTPDHIEIVVGYSD